MSKKVLENGILSSNIVIVIFGCSQGGEEEVEIEIGEYISPYIEWFYIDGLFLME